MKQIKSRFEAMARALHYKDRQAMLDDLVQRYQTPAAIAAYLRQQGYSVSASNVTKRLHEAGYEPVEVRRVIEWRKVEAPHD